MFRLTGPRCEHPLRLQAGHPVDSGGVVRRTVICRENGFYVVQSYLSLSVFFDVNRHMMLSILCTALCG